MTKKELAEREKKLKRWQKIQKKNRERAADREHYNRRVGRYDA